MAYAVDGANIGEFDSHRCLRRLNVHACEEKYIERRGKTKRLVCGSHLVYVWQIRRPDRRHLTYIWQTHAAKTSKTYPRSGCFRRRRAIYKRDVSVRKAKSAIHNADRPVEMGKMRRVWGVRLGNGRPTLVVREFIAFRSVRDRGRRVRRLESCLFRRRQ